MNNLVNSWWSRKKEIATVNWVHLTDKLITESLFDAQLNDYQVKPITDYLPEYNDKHSIILSAVRRRADLSITYRLKLYDDEVGKLKKQFTQSRTLEYGGKSVQLSVTNTCTSKSSGGKKNCGDKCVQAPLAGLTTNENRIRVDGTNKGASVRNEGSTACLKMTVAGKGKNEGTLYAMFVYEPGFIAKSVDKDTSDLFNRVISNADLDSTRK